MRLNRISHEDEGRVEIFIVLPRVIPVKVCRFPAVCGEEVGAGIVGSQWFKELLKGMTEAR